ncbi:MAG: EAL domain-containing protein [Sinobacteraceae bacterium]|nr:EAL domain-containing protein [Nevskiaceae bacterium]
MISDAADASAVRDALINSNDGPFKVDWVRSRADAVKRLTRASRRKEARAAGALNGGGRNVVAMLVDLFLPDSSGLDTFAQLFHAAPEIPILVLSDTQHEDVARLAVHQGAQDYFLKNHLDDHLLPKTLRTIIERAESAEALYEEQERARVTLDSIGDAVISTDLWGRVTYLNVIAEKLTGWTRGEAAGRAIDEVFRAVDGASGDDVRRVMELAIRENTPVGLTSNGSSPADDGVEAPMEDSAAPIHNRRGEVTGAVLVFRDTSKASALSHRMSYLAQHDSLTDLPNRVLLKDRLSHAISLAQRRRKKMAVLFLDIDRFKHINDTLGHEVGDRLLQSVARRLLICVRRSDTVSRQGGDEFVILLSEINRAQDAAGSAEKMLQALSAPHRIGQHELRITASVGIVVYPDDETDAEMLLKHADFAMYHAKEQGRNNYQFFEPSLNARALERQVLESGLSRAIQGDELVLHYQPTLNLQTGDIVGVEAFVRWRHPERGLILPSEFVPIAETSGTVVPMGRWVLREGCRQVKGWQSAGLESLRIAVNVSAAELRDTQYVQCTRRILEETGLAPQDLELELRESVLMQDAPFVLDVLQELKALEIRIALDDFGTGYSSLSHLKQFPIDTLKIDQSFVRELTTDSDTNGIVSAVIGMGRTLGMQVVAEGVESSEQLACLKQLACPLAQGFYFGKPRTAAEFTHLISHTVSANQRAESREGDRVTPGESVI